MAEPFPTPLRFDVEFHGPFRVATGSAKPGFDAVGNPTDPVPASAIKGAARHVARDILGFPDVIVNRLFGSARQAAPWAWTGLEFATGDPTTWSRARVSIDDDTGTAIPGALQFGEEMWADDRATFSVSRIGPADTDLENDALLIAAAACGIHAIGGLRRRGYGWITVRFDPDTVGSDAAPAGVEDWPKAAATAVLKARGAAV